MKKKALLRGLLGFPLGLAIGYAITIACSLIRADGAYTPCAPQLTAMMGSEIQAVLLQALLCGTVGAGFAASSVIWEIENWGIVKQTGIYFLVISAIMLPIAYIAHWMEHSLRGILSYCGIFTLIFVILWVIEYGIIKHNVRKMNEILRKKQEE